MLYSSINSPAEGRGTVPPASCEVLFLKRLLFLKAAIDNESTLNTNTVPFEQEKFSEGEMQPMLMPAQPAEYAESTSLGADRYSQSNFPKTS